MCDFNNGFILCKCNDPKIVVHNKKSRRNKTNESTEYVWVLNKYLGPSKETDMGSYSMPVNDLKRGLTSIFVLSELNKKNCFDFEYSPNEGDNLVLRSEGTYGGRMEFIFKDGNWIEDHYSPFDHVWEKMENGKISTTDSY